MDKPEDIAALEAGFAAIERDAGAMVEGLGEERGRWRESAGSWSVAECLDHLATSNRIYLAAMRGAADRARERGRMRKGPARAGLVGGWFARSLEPPAKFKSRAQGKIRPRVS